MIIMEPLESEVVVPEDTDSWTPPDYQAGVDDPGPVETEFEVTEEELA